MEIIKTCKGGEHLIGNEQSLSYRIRHFGNRHSEILFYLCTDICYRNCQNISAVIDG